MNKKGSYHLCDHPANTWNTTGTCTAEQIEESWREINCALSTTHASVDDRSNLSDTVVSDTNRRAAEWVVVRIGWIVHVEV